MHGLKWTRKALRKVAKALRRKGFKVSHETVRRLLRQLRYQLRVNRKHLGKRQDGERDQQLRYLARKRRAFLKARKPVISVDAKKKELVGNFRNSGRTWRREAVSVLATDFPSDAAGKAIPYGGYDSVHNLGFLGRRMKRLNWRSMLFARGGRPKAVRPTRSNKNCSSKPIVAEPMAIAVGCGSGNFSAWRTKLA